MKDSIRFTERNKELLEQVKALRKHAWEDETPWAVSLGLLEDELRRSLDQQVEMLESYEERLEELRKTWEREREKLSEDREKATSILDKKVIGLQTRITEMEKLREEESYRIKKALTFKEAELERLMRMLKLDPASKRRRFILKVAVGCLAVLCAAAGTWFSLQKWVFWEQQRYELPYAHPSALALIEGEAVVADWVTASLYYHRLDRELSVSRVLFAPGLYFSGLAGDSRKILASEKWQGKIMTLSRLGSDLEKVRSEPAPGPKPSGLYLEGDVLWSADPEAGKIFRHASPEDGVEAREYTPGGLKPRGLVRRNGLLWVLDEATGKVLRNRPGMDADKPEAWDEMHPGFGEDGPRPIAIAADDVSLWILTMRPARLYRCSFRWLESGKAAEPG